MKTPGFSRINQYDYSIGRTRGAMLGVVLELHVPSNNMPRFYNGLTADVLLVESLQEVKDVLIPSLFGGSKIFGSFGIDVTDPEYVRNIREGKPVPNLTTASKEELKKWGSWVLVDSLSNGLLWICGYFPHPARPITHLPQQVSAGQRVTDMALSNVLDNIVDSDWEYVEGESKDDLA